MFLNNTTVVLKENISITVGTGDAFKISTVLEDDTALETSGETVSFVLKDTSGQLERFEITATTGIATIVKRSLTRTVPQTEDSNLLKTWNDGAIGYVTSLAGDMVDPNEENTFEAKQTFTDIDFTGTTTGGLKVKSLTTIQRLAITNAANGMIVYDIDDGLNYQYIAGAWSTFASGAVLNASKTIAGKVEMSTKTEAEDFVGTGGTGAKITITPEQLNPLYYDDRTMAESDKILLTNIVGPKMHRGNISDIRNAIPASTSLKGTLEIGDATETKTGSDNTKAITPLTNTNQRTIYFERSVNEGSGTQSLSTEGFGKAARTIRFDYCYEGSTQGAYVGYYDFNQGEHRTVYPTSGSPARAYSGSYCMRLAGGTASDYVTGVVTDNSAGGFTITWTQTGSSSNKYLILATVMG